MAERCALALQEVMREQQRPWTVRLVNLTEVIDPQGRFRRVTGMDPEDLYNKRLARGWTLDFGHAQFVQQNLMLSDPQMLPDGAFRMELRGEVNKTYYLEASTDLQQWVIIQTNVLNAATATVVLK